MFYYFTAQVTLLKAGDPPPSISLELRTCTELPAHQHVTDSLYILWSLAQLPAPLKLTLMFFGPP